MPTGEDDEIVRKAEIAPCGRAIPNPELVEVDGRCDHRDSGPIDAVVALEVVSDEIALHVEPRTGAPDGTALRRQKTTAWRGDEDSTSRSGPGRRRRAMSRTKDTADVNDVPDPRAREARVDGVERLALLINTPKQGAQVRLPILVTWKRRRGPPATTSRSTVKYAGHWHTILGACRVYVWPGYGALAASNYGVVMGPVDFRVLKPKK